MAWKADFFCQEKTPPTQEKHALLRRAFDDWLASSASRECVIIDGYAGAGRFSDGEGGESPGSPLLLLSWLGGDEAAAPRRLVFVEKSGVNYGRLVAALASQAGLHAAGGDEAAARRLFSDGRRTTVEARCACFEREADALLGDVDERGARAFAFLDPFCFEGLDMPRVAALAQRGAVVVHFAAHAVRKLVAAASLGRKQLRSLQRLYGADEAFLSAVQSTARSLPSADANRYLVDTFVDQLQRAAASLRIATHPLRAGKSFIVIAFN